MKKIQNTCISPTNGELLCIQIYNKTGIDFLSIEEVKTLQSYLQEYLDTVTNPVEMLPLAINFRIDTELNKRLKVPNPNTRLVNTFNAGDRVKLPTSKSIYNSYEWFEKELHSLWLKFGKTPYLSIYTIQTDTEDIVIGLQFVPLGNTNTIISLENDTFHWEDLEHYEITNNQMTEIINIQLNDGIAIEKIQKDLQAANKYVNDNIITIVYDNGVADYYQIESDGSITFLK